MDSRAQCGHDGMMTSVYPGTHLELNPVIQSTLLFEPPALYLMKVKVLISAASSIRLNSSEYYVLALYIPYNYFKYPEKSYFQNTYK